MAKKEKKIITIEDLALHKLSAPINKPKEDLFYNFLANAKSIKILSYTIESSDFATQLFREHLSGKNIEIILSHDSVSNIKSRVNYFEQIGIEVKLANLPTSFNTKCIIIIDDEYVLNNITPLIQNENSTQLARPARNEGKIWNYCNEKPYRCWAALRKKNQTRDAPRTILKSLPEKTIKEKYFETMKNK